MFGYPFDAEVFRRALTVAAWVYFAVWAAAIGRTAYCLLRQLRIGVSEVSKPDEFVSILVPARNEAHRILEESIGSIVDQDLANFELILVNDRSTDRTGEILAGIAARSERCRVIEGTETPSGWLGKPHALKQAFDEARGGWILMSDADIVFDRSAVGSALDHAKAQELDALSLLPRQLVGSFWEQLFLPVFAWFCVLVTPLHRVNDPRKATTFGSGNFFLVRRDALNAIGGFEDVRDDVAEDLKLAELLKRSGSRYQAAYAPRLIATRMYAGLGEIWEGFSKNFFAGMQFSLARTLVGGFWIFVFGVLPPFLMAAALAFGEYSLAVPLGASFAAQIVLFVIVRIYYEANPLFALLAPFGFALFVAVLFNSAFRITSGSGVSWKGRKIYQSGGVRPPKI